MRPWVKERSLPVRALLYAALAALAFALAAGVGALGALALRGDVEDPLGGGQPRPADEGGAGGSPGAASGPASPKTAAAEGTTSGAAQGAAGDGPREDASESAAYVHAATDANSRGDYTYLSHPRIDGDPGAVVLAEPSGSYGHNIGVWYEPGRRRWAVFNQDLAAVPEGASFEVALPPAAEGLVHRAAPPNTVGNATYIDDPLLNGEPGAGVSVTQNWNPGGGGGVYNDRPVGALYDGDVDRWFVYNEDGAPMPEGAAFNVAVSGAAEPAR